MKTKNKEALNKQEQGNEIQDVFYAEELEQRFEMAETLAAGNLFCWITDVKRV
jgi:hypothetical protein